MCILKMSGLVHMEHCVQVFTMHEHKHVYGFAIHTYSHVHVSECLLWFRFASLGIRIKARVSTRKKSFGTDLNTVYLPECNNNVYMSSGCLVLNID